MLRLLAETGGGAVAVSTEDAIAAAREMAAAEGLFPAPESATTLAGLRRAIADGTVDVGERIVLLCTGSGLKSTPVPPLVVPPEINTADDVPARPAPGA